MALLSVSLAIQAEWHGDIKFVSDYIYRGYSKSRGNPVVQARVDYHAPAGWFSGLSLSQVRFDDQPNPERAEMEIMPYVGWHFTLSPDLRADLTAKAYLFDNDVFGKAANYAELYASLHFQDWLSLNASMAPNAYNRDVDTANYEIHLRRDVLDNVRLSAALGLHQAGALLEEDYVYWNAGGTWFVSSHIAFDFRYVDVALDNHHHSHSSNEFYPRLQDNKYLFSVTLGF